MRMFLDDLLKCWGEVIGVNLFECAIKFILFFKGKNSTKNTKVFTQINENDFLQTHN